MASAYVQKKNDIVRALRTVRQALRSNDTLGEKIERALDRLILRKTVITPVQFEKVVSQLSEFVSLAQAVAQAAAAVMSVMA